MWNLLAYIVRLSLFLFVRISRVRLYDVQTCFGRLTSQFIELRHSELLHLDPLHHRLIVVAMECTGWTPNDIPTVGWRVNFKIKNNFVLLLINYPELLAIVYKNVFFKPRPFDKFVFWWYFYKCFCVRLIQSSKCWRRVFLVFRPTCIIRTKLIQPAMCKLCMCCSPCGVLAMPYVVNAFVALVAVTVGSRRAYC